MDKIIEWFEQLNYMEALVNIIGAILIFIVGRWIVRAIVAFMRRQLVKREIDAMLVSFLGNIVGAVLTVAVVLAAIGYLGVPITPLIAILGGAALAVGLALQSSLSNFASGIMLVGFRPFTRDNFVEAGGVAGTVMRVGIVNTELKTPDNRYVVVPNSAITSSPITNYSAYDTRRIDLIIGVHYDDDLKVARDTIARVLAKHEQVLDDPEPTIMLMDLGDSSVDFAVRPWVNTADFWPVRGELLEQLKTELEAAGCSIPFPQRDVHVYEESKANAVKGER
ncbi:mechanosensitive ion channel [Wenzhouxiangella sp. AB-CW3]|uniref:mechanosensitive ion channel family protein n=1 Tax=Wenzhouxiangella sp. AB-CW3 TaxID=2771012 RepID=UPI00168AB73D|nr:mechanosensitive ion channel domain-containing protein [Wenzhouxiangella sp. AB-CW3]QOC23636.1 mechanosensitive ion channel [Wenzhouxiangella sp. AB-CW3]